MIHLFNNYIYNHNIEIYISGKTFQEPSRDSLDK